MGVKTGVIGTGSMGINHARVLSDMGVLTAVFDIDSERSENVATRFGVEDARSVDDVLSRVDAVVIAVPTALHDEIMERSLEMRIHALVEKPISLDPKRTRKALERYEESGTIVAAGHVERFNPAVAFARVALQKQQLGKLISLSSRRVSSFPSRVRDVGVIMDLAIHDIDVITYLAGAPVRRVYATGGRANGGDFEDHANIMLEFENGLVGTCEVNWLTPMKVRKLSLTCDKKYVEIDYIAQSLRISSHVYTDLDPARLYNMPSQLSEQRINPERKEPLRLEIENFIRAVEGKEKPLVSGWDGVRAVEIAQAALTSMKSGRAVEMPLT